MMTALVDLILKGIGLFLLFLLLIVIAEGVVVLEKLVGVMERFFSDWLDAWLDIDFQNKRCPYRLCPRDRLGDNPHARGTTCLERGERSRNC